ncbi:DUF1576 domain-containing protein [Alloiococcus sp. CFN-8]|uniref:DUF1576 domain-containing protein n=1 Tax=Alloiococcus sp. CFN-8 TaxID=3416081 RepID=UPI003CEBA5CE
MKRRLYPAYKIHGAIFLSFIILGFIIDGPIKVFQGLQKIIFNSDILITDYVELAGIGPALVNAGLLTLMIILLYLLLGIKPNGSTIMSFWLIAGFAFFGKNIFNVWPIIFGVYLFSRYQKEPFINFILIAILGTTLAPTVSQLAFEGIFPPGIAHLAGISIGIFIGFILPPLASSTVNVHHGYNLYNLGFSGGLLAMVLMSIYRLLGINFEKRFLWNTENTLFFAVFLYSIFTFLLIYGYIKNGKSFKNVKKIFTHSGKLVTDFYLLYEKAAYINMGILGIVSTTYVLLIGGDLNGPVISGIFTIVGFGTFGKHLFNVLPIMIGASLTVFLHIWELSSPSMLLAILFSTALAPIAGQYGWLIGILTGFLHVAVVMNIGSVHGGMNLYNNGFAAGFVALILIPIIRSFKKGG